MNEKQKTTHSIGASVVMAFGLITQNEFFFWFGILLLLALGILSLLFEKKIALTRPVRAKENPILSPLGHRAWESEAVFNPAAWYDGKCVHVLYRALGPDGISRIGYAKSTDGIHFERAPYPAFEAHERLLSHRPFTSPARLKYDTGLWASGGGWGGSEDPRMVAIDGRVHVTFNSFNGWHSMRVGLLSIPEEDFKRQRWSWHFNFLSPPGRHKNWVLFPEKIRGKFALFHNLFHENPDQVCIQYVDAIEIPDHLPPFESPDPHHVPDRIIGWHHRTRSVGPPPIKTPYGWLLLYHAMDTDDRGRYKVGAMLLDHDDPSRVVCRSPRPILEPDMWYENDWKPGIVYASGAIVKDDTLFLYYGGGDKTVNVATAPLSTFLEGIRTSSGMALRAV